MSLFTKQLQSIWYYRPSEDFVHIISPLYVYRLRPLFTTNHYYMVYVDRITLVVTLYIMVFHYCFDFHTLIWIMMRTLGWTMVNNLWYVDLELGLIGSWGHEASPCLDPWLAHPSMLWTHLVSHSTMHYDTTCINTYRWWLCVLMEDCHMD